MLLFIPPAIIITITGGGGGATGDGTYPDDSYVHFEECNEMPEGEEIVVSSPAGATHARFITLLSGGKLYKVTLRKQPAGPPPDGYCVYLRFDKIK
jgi:hypothetical protein